MPSPRWSTSTRRRRLPSDWSSRIRPAVKQRAGGRCEGPPDPATGARRPDTPRCTADGVDADHITPGDDHSPANLQWLCRPCHEAKTKHEAAAAYRAWRARGKRPIEQHPGLIQRGAPTQGAPPGAGRPSDTPAPNTGAPPF